MTRDVTYFQQKPQGLAQSYDYRANTVKMQYGSPTQKKSGEAQVSVVQIKVGF